MIHMSKKIRLTVVGIALWTIVQTFFHLTWVIYGYYATKCRFKPTYYDLAFVYLTYFYRHDCGNIDLRNEALFLNDVAIPASMTNTGNATNETLSNILYYFLKSVLDKGDLPDKTSVATRTDYYLIIFFVADTVWTATAIALLAGSLIKLKQKSFAIFFYVPWMIVTAYVSFLDVVSSVHFGLDILYIHSYTSWLKFIGVSNYNDFEEFNYHWSSKPITAIPTSILVTLLSRLFFVWVLNIVCFFVILFICIPDLNFESTGHSRQVGKSRSHRSRPQFHSGDELDLNSSEARIRNWQLFYGAIEANSTMASSSSSSSNSDSSGTDHNSNSKTNGVKIVEAENTRHQISPTYPKRFPEKYDQNIEKRTLPSNLSPQGGFRFSGVAEGVKSLPSILNSNSNLNNMKMLRGQMPWSYINPNGDGGYTKRNINNIKKTDQNKVIMDGVMDSTQL